MQRLTILLFLCCSSATLFSQFNRPAAQEVVDSFFRAYDPSAAEYPYVTFEKKANDWFVVLNEFAQYELVPRQRYLFYDSRGQNYRPLPIPEKDPSRTGDEFGYPDPYSLVLFDLQPSFGYEGWYKDVVKQLDPLPFKSDTVLYALGRAYTSWSSSLVSDAAGYAIGGEIFACQPGKERSLDCLDPAQVDSFRRVNARGIACYRQLADRNAAFETRVGPIHRKYANEWMYQYHQLLAYARTYALSMKLPDTLYTDEELAEAKKLLADCPKGAIFLSVGDNDCYPLHYLQKVKGYRTDVQVVNYSLLALDRYIRLARLPLYGALPIRLGLPQEVYADRANEVVYRKPSARTFELSQLAAFFSHTRPDEAGRRTLEAGSIRIRSAAGKPPKLMQLGETRYLLRSDLVLLDMLNNLGTRALCTRDPFGDALEGLNMFMKKKGAVWIYTP